MTDDATPGRRPPSLASVGLADLILDVAVPTLAALLTVCIFLLSVR